MFNTEKKCDLCWGTKCGMSEKYCVAIVIHAFQPTNGYVMQYKVLNLIIATLGDTLGQM